MQIFSKKTIQFILVALLILLALYFRTYVLRGLSPFEKRSLHERARSIVFDRMRDQVRPMLDLSLAGQNEKIKKIIADQRVEEIIQSQRGQFDNAVAETEKKLLEARKVYYSSRYLPEADPYYYLRLTQNVLQTGKLGIPGKNGTYWDPLRYLPAGSWDGMTLHPYLGAWFYRVLRVIRPHISVMKAVSLLPLVLSIAIIFAFLGLGRYLGLSFSSVYLGGLVLILSPMVIQRTVFGWFDTDAYNILFPVLILTTLFAGIRHPEKAWLWGALGGFLTATFALFWAGWSFIFLLVSVTTIILSIWEHWLSKGQKQMRGFALAYFLSSVIFALGFITPGGLGKTLANSFSFVFKASGAAPAIWPNFFILIGETNAVSLPKWVYLVSNYFTAAVALLGLLLQSQKVWRDKPDAAETKIWLSLCLMFAPLFLLSLKAERYVLLVVLPFSIFVAFGCERIGHFLNRKLSTLKDRLGTEPYRTSLVLFLICLLVVPRTLFGADIAARISHLIMNDTWYESMLFLKNQTPKDSVVFSWWSPGHFVTALGDRRVALDGGAQQLKENYWVAKALMSSNENESAGIFRMLTASGNKAFEFLEQDKWDPQVAIGMILHVVKLSRKDTRALLPQNWPDSKKDEFLGLIYGPENLPPAYLLLYDDLVANNVILQLTARWDFRKAAEIAKRKKPANLLSVLLGQDQGGYIQNLIEIAGQPTPYQLASTIVQQRGEQILFENGLVIDEAQQKAFLTVSSPDRQKSVLEPLNFIYKEAGNRWRIKEDPKASPKTAAVLVPLQNGPMAIVAHIDLIKTVLFQLYYLDGNQFTCFSPKFSTYDPDSKTWIRIYEINWKALA